MNRLAWYHHLRSGLNPMPASHAWTQALIYDGKALNDPYFSPVAGDPLQRLDRLVIANYAYGVSGLWNAHCKHSPLALLMAKRHFPLR